jgi:hypothetical protein
VGERQHSDARLVTVVEAREFQQRAATRMSEAERQEFITFIAGHPNDGVVIVGTGGVRIVYYYHNPTMPIFLLTIFAKNERDNLSQHDKNMLKQIVTEIVRTYATQPTHERSR